MADGLLYYSSLVFIVLYSACLFALSAVTFRNLLCRSNLLCYIAHINSFSQLDAVVHG
jgi:hypothetical protein